jgi:hypothetical protein
MAGERRFVAYYLVISDLVDVTNGAAHLREERPARGAPPARVPRQPVPWPVAYPVPYIL